MQIKPFLALASIILGLCVACSSADKERAREQAEEAKQKTQEATARSEQELKRLGSEAKTEAKTLDAKMNQALQGSPSDRSAGMSAQQKLDHAGEQLKTAGSRAGVKLTQAAMIAKVKTKLATDVGVTTVGTINVDSDGAVVTLTGTVPSAETKHQVEQSTSAVDGVTKVINHLTVRP